MRTDTYTKVVLTVIAAALLALAGERLQPLTRVHAQVVSDEQTKALSIPKAYGRLVGYSGSDAVFEDANGTLRVITLVREPTLQDVVTRP